MAIFTKKPYIESVLAEVSGENKAKLLNFINGKGADGTGEVSYTLVVTASALNSLSAGITPVAYKYANAITWKGYFIKTTNFKAFVTFKNGIDLRVGEVYKVDAKGIYLSEEVSADNLRTLLREDSYIDTTELAAVPNVEEAESGTIATTLGLNSSGKVVKEVIAGAGGTKLYSATVYDSTNHVTLKAYVTSSTLLQNNFAILGAVADGSGPESSTKFFVRQAVINFVGGQINGIKFNIYKMNDLTTQIEIAHVATDFTITEL